MSTPTPAQRLQALCRACPELANQARETIAHHRRLIRFLAQKPDHNGALIRAHLEEIRRVYAELEQEART
jgi:hypothetical protein